MYVRVPRRTSGRLTNVTYNGIAYCVCAQAHKWSAALYFSTYVITSSFMMLNLFIGIITANMSKANVRLPNRPPASQPACLPACMVPNWDVPVGPEMDYRDFILEKGPDHLTTHFPGFA